MTDGMGIQLLLFGKGEEKFERKKKPLFGAKNIILYYFLMFRRRSPMNVYENA